MREFLGVFSVCCFIIYCFISLVAFGDGYIDSSHRWKPCERQTKGSRLFPAYRFGCYLGEKVE